MQLADGESWGGDQRRFLKEGVAMEGQEVSTEDTAAGTIQAVPKAARRR